MSSEKEKLYDPHGRGVHPEQTGTPPKTKVQMVQEQVDSTKSEIQKTLQDLANRGQALGTLEEQTAMLSGSASAFKAQSGHVRKTMWWKNTKMTVILTVTIILILAAIIVPVVLKLQGKI